MIDKVTECVWFYYNHYYFHIYIYDAWFAREECLNDEKTKKANTLLTVNARLLFQSRAALSLLAYCYFYMQDFVNAANCYEHLTLLFPDIEEYRLYYAQSLYQVPVNILVDFFIFYYIKRVNSRAKSKKYIIKKAATCYSIKVR